MLEVSIAPTADPPCGSVAARVAGDMASAEIAKQAIAAVFRPRSRRAPRDRIGVGTMPPFRLAIVSCGVSNGINSSILRLPQSGRNTKNLPDLAQRGMWVDGGAGTSKRVFFKVRAGRT